MPRAKQVGLCTQCKELRPIFDVKHGICGVCAGRHGGTTPKKPRIKYFCEVCNKRVKKDQELCSCGAKQDWNSLKPLVTPHG